MIGSLLLVPAALQARSKDNPLRVQVVRSRWHGSHGYREGFGRANLFSQQPGDPPEQGFDFEFSCPEPVRTSFGPDTYTARYGKHPLDVIVQLPNMGTDKTMDCTLRIEKRDYIYVRTGHGLAGAPLNGGPQVPIQEEENQ